MKKNKLLMTLCLNLFLANPLSVLWAADTAISLPKIEKPNADMPVTFEAKKVSHNLKNGLMVAEEEVILSNDKLKIYADYAEYNAKTGDFAARGNIKISQGEGDALNWSGDSISGNIKTKSLELGIFKMIYGAIYICGEQGQYNPQEGVLLPKGSLTTCDCEKPHYLILAKKIRYLPNGSIEAWHLLGKVGKIPFFYLPYIYINSYLFSLDLEYRLGYSNKWGLELGIGKRFKVSENTSLRAMVDVLTRSGPGLELQTQTNTKNSETKIDIFTRYDALADEDLDLSGYYRGFEVDEFRYQLSLFHRQDFEDVEGLSFRAKLDYLSDALYLSDWGKDLYAYDTPQNNSFFELALDADLFMFTAYARPRVNSFDSVAERLPEITLDIPRVNIGEMPLYYEGGFQAGSYKMRWRDYDDPNYFKFRDYEQTRIDTRHFLYLPMNVGENLIQITPRIGFAATVYSNTSSENIGYRQLNDMFLYDDPALQFLYGNMGIPQYNDSGKENMHSRLIAEAGVEVNTKFIKTWTDTKVDNVFFQLDGLRHIVEPFFNYTVTSKPTLERERILFFDEKDQLEQQHFIQAGVRQRWQTRRLGRLFTFASLDAYVNFHFEDEYNMGEHRSHISDFGVRATYRPSEAILLANEIITDLENSEIIFNRSHIQYQSKSGWSTGVSHIYACDEYFYRPAYSLGSSILQYGGGVFNVPWKLPEESNLGTWFMTLPLGERTRLTYTVGYDFYDHNVAGHSLVLNRNLHCWDLGIMFKVDSEDRWGIYFILSLNAFPKFNYQVKEEQ